VFAASNACFYYQFVSLFVDIMAASLYSATLLFVLAVCVSAERRSAIEVEVASSIQASPKNQYGRLDGQSAAVVAHRFFVRQHSWDVSDELIQKSVRDADRGFRGLSHGDVAKAIEAVEKAISNEAATSIDTKGYSLRRHASECNNLKEKLGNISHSGTGRVALGAFDADETVSSLQAAGALEVASPAQARLLVANYMQMPSRCVPAGPHHSACCTNECESIMSQLEMKLQAPFAAPERILKAVARISSSTVQAPRNLPMQLEQQIRKLASQTDDVVDVTGKPLQQWLHYAFPNECALPTVESEAVVGAVPARKLLTAWRQLHSFLFVGRVCRRRA